MTPRLRELESHINGQGNLAGEKVGEGTIISVKPNVLSVHLCEMEVEGHWHQRGSSHCKAQIQVSHLHAFKFG